VVDTVGDGDAFHGALAALMVNTSLTFAQMLRIAATVATASCGGAGHAAGPETSQSSTSCALWSSRLGRGDLLALE